MHLRSRAMDYQVQSREKLLIVESEVGTSDWPNKLMNDVLLYYIKKGKL